MSERQLAYSVRRIRQELSPSPAAKGAINGFLEEPNEGLRFYTTAQREVPLTDYRQGAYEAGINNAERVVRRLADRSFVLCAPVLVRETSQSLRLLFDVEDNDRPRLEELAGAMDEIASTVDPSPVLVYVDLLKKNLKRDAVLRQQAGELLTSQIHHPAARKKLYLHQAKLVTRDIGLSAIPETLPITTQE